MGDQALGVRHVIEVPLSAPFKAGYVDGPFHPELSSCQFTWMSVEESCHKTYVLRLPLVSCGRGTEKAPIDAPGGMVMDREPVYY